MLEKVELLLQPRREGSRINQQLDRSEAALRLALWFAASRWCSTGAHAPRVHAQRAPVTVQS